MPAYCLRIHQCLTPSVKTSCSRTANLNRQLARLSDDLDCFLPKCSSYCCSWAQAMRAALNAIIHRLTIALNLHPVSITASEGGLALDNSQEHQASVAIQASEHLHGPSKLVMRTCPEPPKKNPSKILPPMMLRFSAALHH